VTEIFHCRQRYTTLPPQSRLCPCFRDIDHCFTYLFGGSRSFTRFQRAHSTSEAAWGPVARRNRCGDGAFNGWFYAAGVLRPGAIVTSGRNERIRFAHRGAQPRRFCSLT